jgi:CheY-like chemotaxis protein
VVKILVVDDEQLICEEFKDILEDDGNAVEVAYNGLEALKKIREAEYDLVFLDVLMPHMEGREVFEEIKKISKVPVAIMSGYIPPNKEKEVLASGAVACFRKPLDLGRVRSLVQTIRDKKTN